MTAPAIPQIDWKRKFLPVILSFEKRENDERWRVVLSKSENFCISDAFT